MSNTDLANRVDPDQKGEVKYQKIKTQRVKEWSHYWAWVNPFSAGTAFMLLQTGWIQASRRVTRWLA